MTKDPHREARKLRGETMAAVGAVLVMYGLYSGLMKRDPLPVDSWLVQLLAQLLGSPPAAGTIISVFVGLGVALLILGLEIRRKA